MSSRASNTLPMSVLLSSCVLPNLGDARSISENKPPKSSSLSLPRVLSSMRFNERSSIGKNSSLRFIESIIDELQRCISIYYSILDPSVNYIKANEIIMKQNLQIQKFLESPILVYKDTAVVNVPDYINQTYSGLLNSLKLFIKYWRISSVVSRTIK